MNRSSSHARSLLDSYDETSVSAAYVSSVLLVSTVFVSSAIFFI